MKNRQKFMLEVIIEKTKQHKELRTNLINSGLKTNNSFQLKMINFGVMDSKIMDKIF